MAGSPIRDAVILAAGNGTRMTWHSDRPKPLVEVRGNAMLWRVLQAAIAAGIERAHVVVGYQASKIKEEIGDCCGSVEINWVFNPRFLDLANGATLLCAEPSVDSPFLVLMADHLFAPGVLDAFVRQTCPAGGGLLAIDRKVSTVFDLDDATKVNCEADRITGIGKNLTEFQAIDTGAFLLSKAVFPALRKGAAEADHSLAGGIARLADQGQMRTWDIGNAYWIDVDTPEALAFAERMFELGSLRELG